AVTPAWGEQQEEIGAAAEQLPGQRAGRGPADGVVGAADAQHGHGHLVGVPQGLVALPVGFPARGPAEEGFLQLLQRAAAQQLGHVHRLGQGARVPAGMVTTPGGDTCLRPPGTWGDTGRQGQGTPWAGTGGAAATGGWSGPPTP
uniref:Uncharacterized protein n=1 Tax=Cairina moschata TaxID=8855 RepID=A0A8C3GMK9_CAIMO